VATLAAFLVAQPLLAFFLVVGVGYAVGEINLGCVSLGVGAVLFTGLALGAAVPGAAPPPLLGLLGLVMFLYGIGI
jgi:putative transport protein